MSTQTSASNVATVYENGEQVYPCRCGETHRGPYAVYDWGHHNCFHNAPLIDIGSPEISGYYACPSCGKSFHLAVPVSPQETT